MSCVCMSVKVTSSSAKDMFMLPIQTNIKFPLCSLLTGALRFVLQAVVRELFSQFGSVQSVDLRDHPCSSQESGPKLSKYFRPAEKQVGLACCCNTMSKHWNCLCSKDQVTIYLFVSLCPPLPRVSKLATLCSTMLPV